MNSNDVGTKVMIKIQIFSPALPQSADDAPKDIINIATNPIQKTIGKSVSVVLITIFLTIDFSNSFLSCSPPFISSIFLHSDTVHLQK